MTGVDKLEEGTKVSVEMAMTRTDQPGEREIRRQEEVSPSRTFILRPVATSLLMVGILLAGGVAYQQLPVSALPEVDYPTIQVLTFYPGASPDVMASSVTAPLERQFGQVPGLQQMTSTSSDGSSVITLQFNLSLSIDVAEQEVQQSINAAGTFLPSDLPVPPVYAKTNPADTPILTLALSFQGLSRSPRSRIWRIPGWLPRFLNCPVSDWSASAAGRNRRCAFRRTPRCWPRYGLNLEDLRSALVAANVNQAKGNFDGLHQSYQIGANDQLLSADDYRTLIVAYRNGAPVKLSKVADVIDDVENVRQAAWMNETPAVIMNIRRQPGANIIQVVDRIKQLLPQLTNTLPKSIQVNTLTDRTNTIRASVEDVKFELMLTIGLVVLVIFMFLRNLSATIIPSVAVPLVAGGDFRSDVPARLQSQQPDPDGPHHLDGLRGGRRHRHDREHRPIYRRGRGSVGGGAERRGANRLHHHFSHHLADCGSHPPAVHGRHRGTTVPRIRRHAGGDHPGVGSRLADVDAHDERAAAEAQA